MPRSSSSFIWGIVSVILNIKYNGIYKLALAADFKHKSLPNNVILKIHECNLKTNYDCLNANKLRQWADLIILTKRDIRCCLASIIRKKQKKNKNTFKYFDDNYENTNVKNINNINDQDFICNFFVKNCYEYWKPFYDFEFIYEEYMENKDSIINKIKKLLNCNDILNETIFFELNKLSNKWINNKNHITSSNYKDFKILTKDILQIIDLKYNDYKLINI